MDRSCGRVAARESGNSADRCAIVIMKDGEVVVHVPRSPSRVCALFLQEKVTLSVTYCKYCWITAALSGLTARSFGIAMYTDISADSIMVSKVEALYRRVDSSVGQGCSHTADDT